jgi:hypothetical protein
VTPDSSSERLPAPLARLRREIQAPALLAVGIMTFVSGYVVTALVMLVVVDADMSRPLVLVVFFAFIFYNAHQIPAVVGDGRFVDQLEVFANPATADLAVPVVVFYAIPMVMLVAMGVLGTRLYTSNYLDPRQVIAGVLLLTAGYAAMAILGTQIVQTSTNFGGVATPHLQSTLLFGLLYPLVFGAIGAGLVNVVESLRDLELF